MIQDTVKELIKNSVDPDHLVAILGFNVFRRSANELRAPCIVHGGDNKTAFRLRKDKKTWVCFTKQCHLTYGSDSIGLVQGVLKCDFETAVRFLADITGISVDDGREMRINRIKNELEMTKFAKMRKREYIPPEDVSEFNLEQYKAMRTDYFEQKENGDFPSQVLDLFEIGGCYFDNYDIQREIIPIRDENGKLVAFSGRSLEELEPKYLLTNGFQKDKVLYNLCRAKEFLREKNRYTIIVVEGFKAVWYLHQLGYDNCVACLGSVITPGQINLLCKYASNVVLMLDGGEAGKYGIKAATKDLKGKIRTQAIYIPDDKKSPDDYPPDIVIDWLKNIPN
jgi:DNA primase